MGPENMPYYRGPRIRPLTTTEVAADAHHIQGLLTEIVMSTPTAGTVLANIPVRFGHTATNVLPSTMRTCALHSA